MAKLNKFLILIALAFLLVGPSFSIADIQLTPEQKQILVQKKYQTFEMNPKYIESDMMKGIVYLSAAERELRRVVIIEGQVYALDGRTVPNLELPPRLENEIVNYVMDAAGNIYIFDEVAIYEVRHSSILSGGPVAAAGNIVINHGKITAVDLDSGHYFNSATEEQRARALKQMKTELKSRNVEDADTLPPTF